MYLRLIEGSMFQKSSEGVGGLVGVGRGVSVGTGVFVGMGVGTSKGVATGMGVRVTEGVLTRPSMETPQEQTCTLLP